MNLEAFTGRAEAYTKSRPSELIEAIKYINKIMPVYTRTLI